MYTYKEVRDTILSIEKVPDTFPFGCKLTSTYWAELRGQEHLRPSLKQLREFAEEARREPIPLIHFSELHAYELRGDRTAFERPYLARRDYLNAMVIITLIDDTDLYIPKIQDMLWEICNEYSWATPAHMPVGLQACLAHSHQPERTVELFSAMTASQLAEILFLLGDKLNEWIIHRVRTEMEKRIFAPMYEGHVRFGWEAAANNWSAVCSGEVGIAALILIEDRERLAGIVDRAIGSMECFLSGYDEDGGCAEGIGYWNFGFGYFVNFAEALYEYTDGKLDLLRGEKVRRIAGFPDKVTLYEGKYVNFSDVPQKVTLLTGLACRLADRLGVQVPTLSGINGEMRNRIPKLRNLLWSAPARFGRPVEDGAFYFPDLKWIVHRKKVGGRMIAFAAKGGHNGEPHNHNDVGQFLIHVDGEALLADLGQGLYTRESFGPNRYDILHNSSLGHSVPVVEGAPQRHGKEYGSRVIRSEHGEGGCRFELDLAAAYGNVHLQEAVRSMEWSVDETGSGSGRLVLVDRFLFDREPSSIEEVFISLLEPKLLDGRIAWRGQKGAVELVYDREQLSALCERLDTVDCYGEPQTAWRLKLAVRTPSPEVQVNLDFQVQAVADAE